MSDNPLVRTSDAALLQTICADFFDNSERSASRLQLVSDFCDLTVPSSALGWANLDDGIVGLAGTVSSLIGLYTVWQKTA